MLGRVFGQVVSQLRPRHYQCIWADGWFQQLCQAPAAAGLLTGTSEVLFQQVFADKKLAAEQPVLAERERKLLTSAWNAGTRRAFHGGTESLPMGGCDEIPLALLPSWRL